MDWKIVIGVLLVGYFMGWQLALSLLGGWVLLNFLTGKLR